eukprot:11546013-Ditylum_brightwellii.AAC.1
MTGITIANNNSNNPTVDDKEAKNEEVKETIARGEKDEEKVEESNLTNKEEETEEVEIGSKADKKQPMLPKGNIHQPKPGSDTSPSNS